MKKINLSAYASTLLVSSVLLFSGCGSSSSSHNNSTAPAGTDTTNPAGTDTTAPTSRNITVVDGYIVGATLTQECSNANATTGANGIATAEFNASCGITATGGFIDLNQNGLKDADEVAAPTMKTVAAKDIISPLTDLIAQGANEDKLAAALGVTKADLYTDPIATNNTTVAKAFQIAYAVEVGGKTTEFISKVNAFSGVASASTPASSSTTTESNTSTSQGDLPNVGHYGIVKAVTTTQSDLPSVGHYDNSNASTTTAATTTTSTTTTQGDLPNVGHYDNTTAQATTGSLATFANLAKGLFADGSNEANIIDTIMSLGSDATVEDIETAVQNDKINIAQVATTSEVATDANTTTTDMATDANATATEVATDANTTATEAATDANTTATDTTTDANTTATDTTTDANSDTAATTNEPVNNNGSDLPNFSYN